MAQTVFNAIKCITGIHDEMEINTHSLISMNGHVTNEDRERHLGSYRYGPDFITFCRGCGAITGGRAYRDW